MKEMRDCIALKKLVEHSLDAMQDFSSLLVVVESTIPVLDLDLNKRDSQNACI